MGFLKDTNRKNTNAPKANSNSSKVKNSGMNNNRHEFKVLTIKDVNNSRSKAYNFLTI